MKKTKKMTNHQFPMTNEGLFNKLLKGFLILGLVIYSSIAANAVPIISNVEPTSISDNSFIITWTTTNELASTEILWGSSGLTNVTTVGAATKYHKVELTGLYQNTTYQYRIKSGSFTFPPAPLSPLTFTTLVKPSGEYLFSFAVLNDLRYAEGKASTQNARGIPSALSAQIVASHVTDIKNQSPAFLVLNGNLVDSWGTAGEKRGDQAQNELLSKFATFTGASDLGDPSYKLNPVPGFYDKNSVSAQKTYYSSDWLTDSLNPISVNRKGKINWGTGTEEGYTAADKTTDSVFNHHFKYKYYNFIFLDAIKKPADGSGFANLNTLQRYLSNESNSKTFIFMSYPAYNPLDSSTQDYPIAIPTSEVGGSICIANAADFRATIEAFKDASTNPIVAAVISGHLGDNYIRDINGISYVRQGPALQYPTGYSIYKVYSTGYVKTFYKTTGGQVEGDGDTKPYYEYARDQISTEVVSGTTIDKSILTQFWLGSSSSRNFTYQYAFIPGVSPKVIATAPANGDSAVSLNGPVLINFNKRMSTTGSLTSMVTIKDSDNNPVTVSAASFIDSSRTILQVSHTNFTVDKTYTVTVVAANTKDEGLTPMDADYTFSFNSNGGKSDTSPPTASITSLPENTTSDPFPSLSGVSTDESRVIVVEYRFDNTGSWSTAEAVDGEYTGSVEVFQIKPTSPLEPGEHQVWLRTYDGAGNTSATGFLAYTFTVASDRPNISMNINGVKSYPGDQIDPSPRLDISLISANPMQSARLTLDGTQTTLTLVKIDNTYYSTVEVSPALSSGKHAITVEAFDTLGKADTFEVFPLYVQASGTPTIQNVPLSYPNPFDPGTSTTAISYTMSKAANIVLTIHELSGRVIARRTYSSGSNGGIAGYNEVTWDGKSDSGDYVGNGIYMYLIVADGLLVGQGKITVLKR